MNSTDDEFGKASRRSGRRPGRSGTRAAIERAARRQFGALGYDRTTLRGVAAEAGVDPALVAHFFGTKQQLFVAVVELPFEPGAVIPELLSDPDRAGLRFARFVVGILEDEEARTRITGLVRAAASEPEAARMVRELVTRAVFGSIVEALGAEDAPLRANLVGSQVVGLVMARHVVKVEPLASASADQVAAAIAPVLQRYLTEPLGKQPRSRRRSARGRA